jgi:hypothetical protein
LLFLLGIGLRASGRRHCNGQKELTKSSPRVGLCCHYDEIAGAGGGNYHEIVGFHNPKDVIADYRDFDEDPHYRNEKQHDGYHKQRLETVGQAVNGEPNKISADHNPKGVLAKYRNFSKDSHDRSGSDHERDKPSKEKHFSPPKLRSGNQRKDFADKKEADSAGLIRFAIMAGNAYFEAMHIYAVAILFYLHVRRDRRIADMLVVVAQLS